MSDRVPYVSELVCPSALDAPPPDVSPNEEDLPTQEALSEVALRVYFLNNLDQERLAILTINEPLEALLDQQDTLRQLVYDIGARLRYSVLSIQLELRMPRHENRPAAAVLPFPGMSPS